MGWFRMIRLPDVARCGIRPGSRLSRIGQRRGIDRIRHNTRKILASRFGEDRAAMVRFKSGDECQLLGWPTGFAPWQPDTVGMTDL